MFSGSKLHRGLEQPPFGPDTRRNRVEIITSRERRRRYSAEQKLAFVEETMQPGMTVSAVAGQRAVSPSLLFKWRQVMCQGGQVAVRADEDVIAASRAREMEYRVRELERLRALRRGRASAVYITRDIHGEARIVERAFGLAVCPGRGSPVRRRTPPTRNRLTEPLTL